MVMIEFAKYVCSYGEWLVVVQTDNEDRIFVVF